MPIICKEAEALNEQSGSDGKRAKAEFSILGRWKADGYFGIYLVVRLALCVSD